MIVPNTRGERLAANTDCSNDTRCCQHGLFQRLRVLPTLTVPKTSGVANTDCSKDWVLPTLIVPKTRGVAYIDCSRLGVLPILIVPKTLGAANTDCSKDSACCQHRSFPRLWVSRLKTVFNYHAWASFRQCQIKQCSHFTDSPADKNDVGETSLQSRKRHWQILT